MASQYEILFLKHVAIYYHTRSLRIYEGLNAFLEATKNSGKDIYGLSKTARDKRDDLTAVTQNWMIAKRIFPCTRRICPEPLRIRAKCDMLVEVLLYKEAIRLSV